MGMILAFVAASAFAQGSDVQLAKANAALQAGEADKALSILLPLTNAGSAKALNLKCRVEYSLEQWNRAAEDCEQAVKLDGQSWEEHLWLGRALGEKASRASFLSAYKMAKRVKAEFEEAVRLNPQSGEALADLGNFYSSAPGVVGGGLDKAEGVAAQLDKVDPIRAHELRARIAEKRKDYGAAEQLLKQTITASAHPASQWMNLASFYRERERWTEMESAIHSGQSAAERDKRAAGALYSGAALLIQTNRDPARAAKMLEEYLAGSAKSEDAPAFVAHTWLVRLKRQLGDTAGAGRERTAALTLAHEFQPALDLR